MNNKLFKWIIIILAIITLIITIIIFAFNKDKKINDNYNILEDDLIEIENSEKKLDIIEETELELNLSKDIEIKTDVEIVDENYDIYAEKVLKTDEVIILANVIKEAYGSSYDSKTMKEMKADDVDFDLGLTYTLYDEMYGETSINDEINMLYVFKVSDENKNTLIQSLLNYQYNLIDNAMLENASKEYLTKLSYNKLTALNGYVFYYCLGNYNTTIMDETEKQEYYELQSSLGLDAVISYFNEKANTSK